jgi:hypothetical protein
MGQSHRLASTSILMPVISDIWHQHLLLWYRKKIRRTEKSHFDIGRVPISTSESIPISNIQKILTSSAGFGPKTLIYTGKRLTSQPLCWSMNVWMSDIRYQIKVYSDIPNNVQLCSLQSDIGSSNIRFSQILLITDIGVSAHLWPQSRI